MKYDSEDTIDLVDVCKLFILGILSFAMLYTFFQLAWYSYKDNKAKTNADPTYTCPAFSSDTKKADPIEVETISYRYNIAKQSQQTDISGTGEGSTYRGSGSWRMAIESDDMFVFYAIPDKPEDGIQRIKIPFNFTIFEHEEEESYLLEYRIDKVTYTIYKDCAGLLAGEIVETEYDKNPVFYYELHIPFGVLETMK